MRMVNSVLNAYRIRHGPLASNDSMGLTGAFQVPFVGKMLRVIANTANTLSKGWEHVSVSLSDRCPTWTEMDYVKDLWWRADECVMQLHVPKREHINCHPFTLHLWRPPEGVVIPQPPAELVGPKGGIH